MKKPKDPSFHGLSKTRIYGIWACMIQRCENPNNANYHHYGGRGIRVCERWHEFTNFYEDMGERPDGKTLDRENNDGDYEPENCRWATHHQQKSNSRRNAFITHNGETLTMTDWSKRLGGCTRAVKSRVEIGWDEIRAVTEPLHAYKFRGQT